jgi:hypothetical protein
VTREDLEQDKERGLDGTTVGYSNGFKRSGMSDEEFRMRNKPVYIRIIFPMNYLNYPNLRGQFLPVVPEGRRDGLMTLIGKYYLYNIQRGRHPLVPAGTQLIKLAQVVENGIDVLYYVPEEVKDLYEQRNSDINSSARTRAAVRAVAQSISGKFGVSGKDNDFTRKLNAQHSLFDKLSFLAGFISSDVENDPYGKLSFENMFRLIEDNLLQMDERTRVELLNNIIISIEAKYAANPILMRGIRNELIYFLNKIAKLETNITTGRIESLAINRDTMYLNLARGLSIVELEFIVRFGKFIIPANYNTFANGQDDIDEFIGDRSDTQQFAGREVILLVKVPAWEIELFADPGNGPGLKHFGSEKVEAEYITFIRQQIAEIEQDPTSLKSKRTDLLSLRSKLRTWEKGTIQLGELSARYVDWSESLVKNRERFKNEQDIFTSFVEPLLREATRKFSSVETSHGEDNNDQSLGPKQGSSGVDDSRSLNSVSQVTKNPGGIDFRFLPIVIQSMDNLRVSIQGQSPTGTVPVERYARINLTQEWSDIERLVNSGITPSAERLKDYFAVSYFKGNLDSDRERIVSCISDILRMEEVSCSLTDPTLKDILVVLGSGRSAEELKLAFAN